MPENTPSKDGDGADRGTSIFDARRAWAVAILALVVVWFQAGILGTVETVSAAAVQFAVIAIGGYAGLTTGDRLLNRLTRSEP